ncbi:MAG: hypothetical protein HRT44_06000 [Bdellovibrionales bacterium]|nr:hypothetical protein [Bdellovibrionales bacterium]NQZ18795.1 hypothetical protein [Bdellovibrionales bacterium]
MKRILALSAFILTFSAQAKKCEIHSFKGPSQYNWSIVGEESSNEECNETYLEIILERAEEGFSKVDVNFDLRCTSTLSHGFGSTLPMTGNDILKNTINEETQEEELKRYGLISFNDKLQIENLFFDFSTPDIVQTINLERISATAYSLNYYNADAFYLDHVFSYRLNPNGITIKKCVD